MAEKEVGQIQVKLIVVPDDASAQNAARRARDTAQREMGGGGGGGPGSGVPVSGGGGGGPPTLQQVRYDASIARLSEGRQAQANVFAVAQGGFAPGTAPFFSTGTTANLMQASINEQATRQAQQRENRFVGAQNAASFAAFKQQESNELRFQRSLDLANLSQQRIQDRALHQDAVSSARASARATAALSSLDRDANSLYALEEFARAERRAPPSRPARTDWRTLGQTNIMGTGMLMQLMFGGWEAATALGTASQARYAGMGSDAGASAMAEFQLQQMVRRGPLGSIAGQFLDPMGHQMAALGFSAQAAMSGQASVAGGYDFRTGGLMLSQQAGAAGLRGVAGQMATVDLQRIQARESVKSQAAEQSQRIIAQRDNELRADAAARNGEWWKNFWKGGGILTGAAYASFSSYKDNTNSIMSGAASQQASLSAEMRRQLESVEDIASESGRKIIRQATEALGEGMLVAELSAAGTVTDPYARNALMRKRTAALFDARWMNTYSENFGAPAAVRDAALGEVSAQRAAALAALDSDRFRLDAAARERYNTNRAGYYRVMDDQRFAARALALQFQGGGTASEQIAFARAATLRRTGSWQAGMMAGAIAARDIGIQDDLMRSEGRQLDSLLAMRPLDAAAQGIAGEAAAAIGTTGNPATRELIRANAEKRIRLIGQQQLQPVSGGTGSIFQIAQGGSGFNPNPFINQVNGAQGPNAPASPQLAEILSELRNFFTSFTNTFTR